MPSVVDVSRCSPSEVSAYCYTALLACLPDLPSNLAARAEETWASTPPRVLPSPAPPSTRQLEAVYRSGGVLTVPSSVERLSALRCRAA